MMARTEPHKGILSSVIASLLWVTGLSSFIILIGFYLLISLIIPPRKVQWILLYMSRVILLFCGQYMKVHGDIPAKGSGPYIYMFNHESLFDIFLRGSPFLFLAGLLLIYSTNKNIEILSIIIFALILDSTYYAPLLMIISNLLITQTSQNINIKVSK